ncbi:hypothetical protein [Sphingomonas oryzagri]
MAAPGEISVLVVDFADVQYAIGYAMGQLIGLYLLFHAGKALLRLAAGLGADGD